MKNSNGITIIALIITVILTIMLASIVIKFGTSEIDKAKIEDLKATMLLIKGRAQIAIDKDTFGEEYDKTGILTYEEASEIYTPNIPSNLASQLTDTSNLYIWTQDAMDNNGIDVKITPEDFFIIKYSTTEDNTIEVYSSLGYTIDNTTYYSLTELQNL